MLARECLSEFKLDCQLRRLSHRTIKSYHNNVALFLNYLETKFELYELEEIRAPHLKSYFQYLLDKQLSPSYANGVLKSIRAFFRFAHAEEYLSQNPALKVRWQKEGIVLIKTFTDDEVRRLICAFDGKTFLSMRNKLIIALAFDTGARNAEICDIKSCDIKDSLLLLHGKGNKERYIPLTPYIKKLMNKYDRMKQHYFLDKRIKSDYYFLSRTGRQLTREALENIFNKANDVAKVRYRCFYYNYFLTAINVRFFGRTSRPWYVLDRTELIKVFLTFDKKGSY